MAKIIWHSLRLKLDVLIDFLRQKHRKRHGCTAMYILPQKLKLQKFGHNRVFKKWPLYVAKNMFGTILDL